MSSRPSPSVAPLPARRVHHDVGGYHLAARQGASTSRPSCGSTASTVSRNRKVTARLRRWNCSASTISSSQNSSIRSRCSITVTLVPRAAKIRGVLDADDAGPDDHERPGDLAAARGCRPSRRCARRRMPRSRAGRARADGDDRSCRPLTRRSPVPLPHRDRVSSTNWPGPGGAATRFLRQLVADHFDLSSNDMVSTP